MPCLRIFEANPARMPGMVLVLAEYRQSRRLSADSARARLRILAEAEHPFLPNVNTHSC